jgi:hypothetical protein
MKKYLFYVNVGDLPPLEATSYLNKVKEQVRLEGFLPEGRTLFLPTRHNDSRIETIEVDW